MDHLCRRCARIALYTEPLSRNIAQPSRYRAFSTATTHLAEETPKPINRPPPSKSFPPRDRQSGSSASSRPANAKPRDGPLLRRVSIGSDQPPRKNGPPPGALLRRSGPAPQHGQVLRRTGPPRTGGKPGQSGKTQGFKGKQTRRKTAESVRAKEAEDTPPTEEELEEAVTRYINPPMNPTKEIEYNPKPLDPLELRKDWPNTPLSTTGLSASVVQKIEWLARRLPHGYQAPEHLAEHFYKGNLTRFESEEEKQQVLKLAAELAQARANDLSERKGEEIAADDMGFSDLSSKGEGNAILDQVVKGKYGDLEKQRMPFLDSIMRNLRNNQTYHKTEMAGFMKTVERLMPAQAQRRAQPQQAEKKA